VYEWVNGSSQTQGHWQTQYTPLYHASVDEFDDVLQWYMPDNSPVGLMGDVWTFRLLASRYMYVDYSYCGTTIGRESSSAIQTGSAPSGADTLIYMARQGEATS
jgi:hypothetical protein